MIISDRAVKYMVESGSIQFDPIPEDKAFGPASVDLRLAKDVSLYPGNPVRVATKEFVTLPPYIAGVVKNRSSMGRRFIDVGLNAGFIDPGFSGQITLTMLNFGQDLVELKAGERFCQLVLHLLDYPAERPYGVKPGSKYQGSVGVVEAKED